MNNRQTPSTSSGTQRNRKKIYGLIGGAALAAAVTFGGNAVFPAITTTQAQAVTATPPASSTAAPDPAQQAPVRGQPGQGVPGNLQGGRGGPGKGQGQEAGRNGASGTISAISGNSITLKQGDVIVIQATVNANTTYTKAGKTISLSDLKAGQLARVQTTTATDGTVSVSAVEVLLNHAGGTISAVDASSLTLTKSDNSTVKVSLSSATTYQDLGKAVSLADLKAGVKVDVAGTLNSDGTLSAEVINIQHDRLGGTITAINGTTVTVQVDGRGAGGPGGRGPGAGAPGAANGTTTPTASSAATTTKTINLSSGTTYLQSGQAAQVSDLAVGERIDAVGTLSSDGNSISALQVSIQLPHYQGQVTSVTGSTIVIQDRAGSRTIEVSSSTKYLNGEASAALGDVKVGSNVSAEGKVDASGKMTASVIQLGRPTPPNGGQGHK